MTTTILNSKLLIFDRALKFRNNFLATIDDITIITIIVWLEIWVLNAHIADLSWSLIIFLCLAIYTVYTQLVFRGELLQALGTDEFRLHLYLDHLSSLSLTV